MKFDSSLNLNQVRATLDQQLQYSFAYKVFIPKVSSDFLYPLSIKISNNKAEDFLTQFYGGGRINVPTTQISPAIIVLTFIFDKELEVYTKFLEFLSKSTGNSSTKTGDIFEKEDYDTDYFNSDLKIDFLKSDASANKSLWYREIVPLGIEEQRFGADLNEVNGISTYTVSFQSSYPPVVG
jgi:hypothetical protein